MSSTIYNKAFALQLSHLFYTVEHRFNVNQQLDLFTTVATADLIRKGRMRMVRTGAGADVFFQSYLDAAPAVPVVKPLVELTGPLEFVFALKIKPSDVQFLNTTDLDQGGSYSSGNVFLLDGTMPAAAPPAPTAPVDLALTASLLDRLLPSVCTYSFLPVNAGTTVNLIVDVYTETGVTPVLTINPVTVDPATGIYSVQLDLSAQPNGVYRIEAKDGITIEHSATVYIDTQLARENIFGLIRLKYPDADYFYNGLPDRVTYEFEAREIKWRYYVAIKSVPANFFATHSLEILDDNLPDPPVYTFTGLDGGIPSGTVTINGQPTVIITSDQDIPFSETAIDRFYLRQVNPGPVYKTLMVELPNAATNGVDSNQVGIPGQQYAEIFLFLEQVTA